MENINELTRFDLHPQFPVPDLDARVAILRVQCAARHFQRNP